MRTSVTTVAFILIALLCTYLQAEGAKQAEDKHRDDPPSFMLLYSSTGNEKFQVECSPKAKAIEVVNCTFLGARVDPFRTSVSASPHDKLSEKEKQQIKAEFTKEDEQTIKAMEEKLSDLSTGPKTRDFWKSFIAAYKAGDASKIDNLLNEKKAHTCRVSTQTFSLEFKKLGPHKWVSNPSPSGPCQIVKIYELTENETHDLWEMTEIRVTAGFTDGNCKDVHKELQKPVVWSWKNPSEYELSCDFMTFDIFWPH